MRTSKNYFPVLAKQHPELVVMPVRTFYAMCPKVTSKELQDSPSLYWLSDSHEERMNSPRRLETRAFGQLLRTVCIEQGITDHLQLRTLLVARMKAPPYITTVRKWWIGQSIPKGRMHTELEALLDVKLDVSDKIKDT